MQLRKHDTLDSSPASGKLVMGSGEWPVIAGVGVEDPRYLMMVGVQAGSTVHLHSDVHVAGHLSGTSGGPWHRL